MRRVFPWLLALTALLVLGGYLWWPREPTPEATFAPFADLATPATMTVRIDDLVQRLDGDDFTVAGLARDLDRDRLARLLRRVRRLRAHERVVAVGADELPAYGINGAWRLELDGRALAWGLRRGQTWIHDARTDAVYAVGPARIGADMAADWRRLDRPDLLPGRGFSGLRFDDLVLAIDPERGWIEPARPDRPSFTRRVHALAQLVRTLELEELTPPAPHADATLMSEVVFEFDDREVPMRVWRDGARGWVRVGDLPAQPVAVDFLERLRERLASFAENPLFALTSPAAPQPIERVVVYRDGVEALRCDKETLADPEDPRSPWTVQWPEGVEMAADDVGARFRDAFNGLLVREPVLHVQRRPLPREAAGVVVEVAGKLLPHGSSWVHVTDDGRVASPRHDAVIDELAPLLADPQVDDLLDPHLLRVEPERVDKLQRVVIADEGTVTAEVVDRTAAGWRLVRVTARGAARARGPERAVDPRQVQRLLRLLALSRTGTVRLATAADRALWRDPARRLRLRLAPLPVDDAHGLSRIEDTVAREWAVALGRLDTTWVAVREDDLIAWELTPELVDDLFASLVQPRVLPLVPAHVQALEVWPKDGPGYRLERVDDGWVLIDDAGRHSAVARQVERYLAQLAGLVPQRHHPRQAPVSDGDELRGRLRLVLPGLGREREEIVIHLGVPVDGVWPLSVTTTRLDTELPAGRIEVAPERPLLWPRDHLLPVDGTGE